MVLNGSLESWEPRRFVAPGGTTRQHDYEMGSWWHCQGHPFSMPSFTTHAHAHACTWVHKWIFIFVTEPSAGVRVSLATPPLTTIPGGASCWSARRSTSWARCSIPESRAPLFSCCCGEADQAVPVPGGMYSPVACTCQEFKVVAPYSLYTPLQRLTSPCTPCTPL